MNAAQRYRHYTNEDKAALKELKAETEAKLSRDVKLGDMIAAVEPEMETPEELRNC